MDPMHLGLIKDRDNLDNPNTDGRIILKWI
jgi:hypothetical protein